MQKKIHTHKIDTFCSHLYGVLEQAKLTDGEKIGKCFPGTGTAGLTGKEHVGIFLTRVWITRCLNCETSLNCNT